jgi:hypothetical protein
MTDDHDFDQDQQDLQERQRLTGQVLGQLVRQWLRNPQFALLTQLRELAAIGVFSQAEGLVTDAWWQQLVAVKVERMREAGFSDDEIGALIARGFGFTAEEFRASVQRMREQASSTQDSDR